MIEKAIEEALHEQLQQYAKKIPEYHLKVDTKVGRISMEGAELEAQERIALLGGKIERVSVGFNLSRIATDPIIIEIEGIQLQFGLQLKKQDEINLFNLLVLYNEIGAE